MSRQVFSFDASRCAGCQACAAACQDQNDALAGGAVAFREVTRHEEGPASDPRIASLSLSCQHCGDAPCLVVCPMQAISRRPEDGAILVERAICVGCRSCQLACPNGAPKFPEDGRMAKCDSCHIRRDHGMRPACVRACLMGALAYGPLEEIGEKKMEQASLRLSRGLTGSSDEEG